MLVWYTNYKEWSKKNIKDKLIDLMRSNYENIIFWDQDVLNLYFDGNFNRIDKDLNYNFIKNSMINHTSIQYLNLFCFCITAVKLNPGVLKA